MKKSTKNKEASRGWGLYAVAASAWYRRVLDQANMALARDERRGFRLIRGG